MRPTPWMAASALALGTYGVSRMRRDSLPFRKKVVVITGGPRGLGLAMARRFAARGASLVLCSRTASRLARAREEFEKQGVEILAVRCDVGDEGQVRELVRQTLARFGRVDILVNNAGIIQVGPLDSMSREEFAAAMDTMFWGTYHVTMSFLPHLFRGSRIVNITSIGGVLGIPHLAPYCAAKFAARGFSESLRSELHAKGIRVTTVVPGLMRTGSFRNALFKGSREREMDWFALGSSLPLVTTSADRAAAGIVTACQSGRAYLVIGWPAKLGRLAHGLFPGVTAAILARVNALLPKAPAGSRHQKPVRGDESRDALTRSPIVGLGDRAARDLNEAV